MILREIAFKTFDDEIAALANLRENALNVDAVFGAILALRWLRNGGIAPSIKLTIAHNATPETH